MIDTRTLIAGPWTGSLQGELICWQGYIRALSKRYTKTIVISDPTHAFLYRDFATEIVKEENLPEVKDSLRIMTRDTPVRWISKQPIVDDQLFVSIGQKAAKKFSITICASESDQFTKKDWAQIAASQSINMDIAWVSDVDKSYYLGGSDYRKRALGSVASAIRKSEMVVAPSGGIAILAGLCKIPYITWLPSNIVNLYKDVWNPLNTPGVAFKGHPTATQVIEAIKRLSEMQNNQDKELCQD